MNRKQYEQSTFNGEIENIVRLAESMRSDDKNPLDISFAEILKEKHNITYDAFLADIGINLSTDTISNIVTTGDVDVRWIIPEIFRDALRLGLRKAPIWSNITAAETQVKGLSVVMPHIDPSSDAAPRKVGEAETIPTGTIKVGQKTIDIFKIGRGIKIPYEVTQYASLDVVGIFLQDMGVKLGLGLDTLAIDTIINGEQASGSESSPVIGIGTPGTKVYADYLRTWIRLSRIGRLPNVIIGGEAAALQTLDLPEFKTNINGGAQPAGVPTSSIMNLKTPIPRNSSYYIHGNVPTGQEIIMDSSSTLIKFNAQPLLVESEKIVSNQTTAFYASLTTGFAKLFRDSAVLVDSSLNISAAPFPAYMDVDPLENVIFE